MERETAAQTDEGQSEAKTHTPKDLPSGAECAHTDTESLVGNEGLKSESIMNVPSGGFGAISREPGNEKWNTEKYGPAGSDVSKQHVIQWVKYICIHPIRKKAIFY